MMTMKLWVFVIVYIITLSIAILFIVLYATKSTSSNCKTDIKQELQDRSRMAASAKTVLINENPFEKIDKIYYINMDHRLDRKYEIENELKSMNIPKNKIKRIPGVSASFAALGCSKAHLNALKDFQENKYKTCLILEDDFMFKQCREEVFNQLNKFWSLNLAWDVVLLSSYTLQYETTYVDFLLRLKDAQTASGYMINSKFLPELLKNVENGIELLEKDSTNPLFCIDQYWKLLQPTKNWYTFYPVMAHQRPGFSDIEKTNVNYLDKNELTIPEITNVSYIISVLSCSPRLKKSEKQIAALNTLFKNHNIQYFYYYGDPNLSKDFELNLTESTVCLRDKDDYLNLSHKIGQMIYFLKNYITINSNHYSKLKGFLFIDDDLDIYTEKFLQFLDDRNTIPFWGNTFTHSSGYSDHLKTKNEQSVLIKNTLLNYPDLLLYPIKIRNDITYCSGGCFYLTTDTLKQLANLNYAFKTFPENNIELSYHKKINNSGQAYFDNLCVFSDIDVGSALKDIGITPIHAPIKQIVYWEGLK